jgi:NTP pyrophosphatase (non-canonical NTP hydrolase)
MSKPPILPNKPTLKDYQAYIEKIVKNRGFDKDTPQDRLVLLVEEVGELAKAIREKQGLGMAKDTSRTKVSEELADCLLHLLGISNLYDIDLEKAFRNKEEKNKQRNWSKP